MAYPPIQNRINGHVWFSATANAVIQLSDMAVSSANEAGISAASITKLIVAGPWKVSRGSNVVFQTESNVVSQIDFSGNGLTLSQWNTANIVVNTTSSSATIFIECNKETYANGTAGGL